jgi:menaquinone-dependent protoporphyrinogen oxidase
METNNSRREFIKKMMLMTISVSGLYMFGRSFSFAGHAENPDLLEELDEQEINNNTILVTYESQYGSTAEIAHYIGKLLRKKNKVDVLRIKDVKNPARYSQIIIGSPIQYDKWMPEAREFVSQNRMVLKNKSIAFFFTCLVLSQKTEKTKTKANEYAAKLYKIAPEVKPVSIGKFAGVLNYDKMSLVIKYLFKGIMAFKKVKEGDYRDWNAVKNWVKTIEN